MAAKQDYLDNLKRLGMVGKVIALPPYYAQPFRLEAMSPEQWRDLVLQNFTEVYLTWWTESFKALLDASPATIYVEVPVYNPNTQLWELATVPAGEQPPVIDPAKE